MNQKLDAIFREVQKALTGKQAVVEKVLMAMLCGGHILLDDVPGVGKTTLAVAFSKALGLRYRRIQFTPDVLPSDIVGFSMYVPLCAGHRDRHQSTAGRRDQPHLQQDAVCAFGGHGGKAGHCGRDLLSAA